MIIMARKRGGTKIFMHVDLAIRTYYNIILSCSVPNDNTTVINIIDDGSSRCRTDGLNNK